MNKTVLLDALAVLVKTCEQASDCKYCPLHDPNDKDGCFALESPSSWDINEDFDDVVPSVFDT